MIKVLVMLLWNNITPGLYLGYCQGSLKDRPKIGDLGAKNLDGAIGVCQQKQLRGSL